MKSKHFDKVKGYYDNGFWTKNMVANAVTKGWITQDEYNSIIGND